MIFGKDQNDEEVAEKLMQHRARTLPFLIAVFVFLQVATAIKINVSGQLSTGGWTGWLIVAFVLLHTVAAGGAGLARRPGIRVYIDDELTCSHRAKAFTTAFWAMMVLGVALMAVSNWYALNAQLALHCLVGIGTIAATTRYTMLERRALKA